MYIRLSREDGNDESYSVKNQRQRLKGFLETLMPDEEMERIDIYVDDGCTGTDRDRDVYEMGVSIQSMYNENHCRETSIKVRGTFDMKRKRGEFIGAFAPYGYMKDPDNKNRLIVDDETAHIVKDIFYWFVQDGMSKNGIVRKLISMGIPCASEYKRQKGMNYRNPAACDLAPHC